MLGIEFQEFKNKLYKDFNLPSSGELYINQATGEVFIKPERKFKEVEIEAEEVIENTTEEVTEDSKHEEVKKTKVKHSKAEENSKAEKDDTKKEDNTKTELTPKKKIIEEGLDLIIPRLNQEQLAAISYLNNLEQLWRHRTRN